MLLFCLGREFGSSFALVKMYRLGDGFALGDWGQLEAMTFSLWIPFLK